MSQSISGGGHGRLQLQGRSISRGPSSFEILALVAIALAAAFGGYKLYASVTDLNQPAPAAPAYIPAFETTLNDTISASGRAPATQQSSLTFGSSGEVEEVLVELGDSVITGQELARIEDSELSQAVEAANAALVLAEANLDLVLDGPTAGETASVQQSLASAQEEVLTAQLALDEILSKPTLVDIAAAEQSLLSAEIALQNAKDAQAAAQADLSDPQNAEAIAGGQLKRAVQNAELGLLIAQDNYDDVIAGPDASEITAARLRLATAQASLASAKAQNAELLAAPEPQVVLPLEATVTQARIAFENAEKELEAATIVAPFDGLITSLNVAVGDELSATTTALVLINPNLLEIESDVDQSDISSLAPGQPATGSP